MKRRKSEKTENKRGFLATVGLILSPLSWWNDLVVNLPLAYGFAWLLSLVYKPLFSFYLVVGYWLTNVIGLVLLHRGVSYLAAKKEKKFTGKDLRKDVLLSLFYTALVILLIKLGILKSPA